MDDKVIITNTKVRPISYRGPLNSAPLNDFHEEVAADISNIANAVNTIHNNLGKVVILLQNENQFLRRQVDSLKQQQK